jgi:hypothetical protein
VQNFNNEAYELLLTDLINDAFYVNTSNRGKIAKIRQCAEVVMRRILMISPTKKITLGCNIVIDGVNTINNHILTNARKIINSDGNDSTHTQDLTNKTDADVKRAVDALFDLYAYLLIAFFEKYPLGTNVLIMEEFSLLPPIIRYKALDYLFKNDPKNIFIVWKLSLALLKAKAKDDAIKWIDANKNSFTSLGTEMNGQKLGCSRNGETFYFDNMYDLCIYNINLVSADKKRVVYNDFESALSHYKEHDRLNVSSQDEIEFNSIIEFLYLGRKENTAT